MNIAAPTTAPAVPLGMNSPALDVVEKLAWAHGGTSAIQRVSASGLQRVSAVVPGESASGDGSRRMADVATAGLRQSIDGVRMLYVDQHGQAGNAQGIAGQELAGLYMQIPGVLSYGQLLWDVDGDGTVRPDELANIIEGRADELQRLSELLPEQFDGVPFVFVSRVE